MTADITPAQMKLLRHLGAAGERGDIIGDARQIRSRLIGKGLVEWSGMLMLGYKTYRLTPAGVTAIRNQQ
jgi:hypothetical protein